MTSDVTELVQRLSQALATDVARKGIAFEVNAPQQLICECDRVRVEQVVWNLIGNAVKFTPAGGRIAVSLRLEDVCARLDVEDSGVGIAPECLPHVFELFSQAEMSNAHRPGRAGLGIGLALARELVRLMGGVSRPTDSALEEARLSQCGFPRPGRRCNRREIPGHRQG